MPCSALSHTTSRQGLKASTHEFDSFADLETACTDIEDSPEEFAHCTFYEEMKTAQDRRITDEKKRKSDRVSMNLATQDDYADSKRGKANNKASEFAAKKVAFVRQGEDKKEDEERERETTYCVLAL